MRFLFYFLFFVSFVVGIALSLHCTPVVLLCFILLLYYVAVHCTVVVCKNRSLSIYLSIYATLAPPCEEPAPCSDFISTTVDCAGPLCSVVTLWDVMVYVVTLWDVMVYVVTLWDIMVYVALKIRVRTALLKQEYL